MGRVFLYAFVNEVVRMKTPFPFDCESAQVVEDNDRLLVLDKEGRSVVIENTGRSLILFLDDKRTENIKRIEHECENCRKVLFDWLKACIQYTSLQPELREELNHYVSVIQRKF